MKLRYWKSMQLKYANLVENDFQIMEINAKEGVKNKVVKPKKCKRFE